MDAEKKPVRNKQLIQWLRWAIVATILATLGDFVFMLLFVLDTTAMELNMVRLLLWMAGVLGAVAIPFYAIGYRAISAIIFTQKSFASNLFINIAVVASLCGGAIHGITAVNMYGRIENSSLGADPMVSMMSWGRYFLGLWAVAVVGIIIGSSLYFWFVIRGKAKLKRKMAYLNPVFITIGIILVSLLFGTAGTYIAPTAPNMAHIVFFVLILSTRQKTVGRG